MKQKTDEEIAAALLECSTKSEAAERLGIDRKTLYNRMQSHEVQAILSAMRADRLRSRLAALDAMHQKAIDTICGVLDSDTASNTDRLKAASMALNAERAARAELNAAECLTVERLRCAAADEWAKATGIGII